MQEPPSDLDFGQNSPQARAAGQAQAPSHDRRFKRKRTQATGNVEPATSSLDETSSSLDQVELDIIQYPEGVQTASTVNSTLNKFLMDDFANADLLIKAIKLLSNVSSGAASPTVDLTTIPLALEVSGNHLGPNLIAASCRANAHLQGLEGNVAATRLRTILSYIILYLTLEHVIVPELRRDNPTEGLGWVNGKKHLHFAEILNAQASSGSTSSGPKISGVTLRNHIVYGRSFWEYGQALGIASLLVFAVGDIGLSRIGGSSDAGIPIIASALTTDDTWWAFAHAISPATFRTLFGACDIAYSVPQLLSRIRREPIPRNIITAINQEYTSQLQSSANQPTTMSPSLEAFQGENWRLTIGEGIVPIQRHPKVLESENVVRRNLGNWLKNTDGDYIVEDEEGNQTPFHAFKSLLPPSTIANELVNFLTNVFNAKAIPGRVALPVAHGNLASFTGTFEQFRQGLIAGQPKGGEVPERIICPFDIGGAMIGIVLSATKSTMIVYNWLRDQTLADGIVKVFYKLEKPFVRL